MLEVEQQSVVGSGVRLQRKNDNSLSAGCDTLRYLLVSRQIASKR
jgi:hypothetical protein